MKTGQRRRWVLLAVMGLLLLVTVAPLPGATVDIARGEDTPIEPPVEFPIVSGVGETLILVTGGLFDSESDAAIGAQASANGDMQGFYVDRSENYVVKALYSTATRETVRVDCSAAYAESIVDLAEYGVTVSPRELDTLCESAAEGRVPGQEVSLDFPVPISLSWSPVVENMPWIWYVPVCVDTDVVNACIKQVQDVVVNGTQLPSGKYVLVSAFRTKAGAEEFMQFMRSAGHHVSALQVVKTGGDYVGLGQESHPDGSGPLQSPLPNQELYQR